MQDMDFMESKGGIAMEERRRNRRLDLKVTIQLERVEDGEIITIKYATVDVQDISKSGIGFCSSQILEIGEMYKTKVKIWTNETIRTIVKIVRCEKSENVFEYGAQFVGMNDADELKIGIYEMINEKEDE